MPDVRFPNESDQYREARNKLLKAETDLRARLEEVAKLRRQLPPGGELKEDYTFEELVNGTVRQTRLSELFDEHDTLFIYGFMYAPDMKEACPMCTALLDGLDGQAEHLQQRISTAVVAKHDIKTVHAHAQARGWRNMRLLSSSNNTYNVDYFGEIDGRQMTAVNVFQRDGKTIRHFWNAELSYQPMMEGGNMRHVDLIWPLWGALDMTPNGRGDWYPRLTYDEPR